MYTLSLWIQPISSSGLSPGRKLLVVRENRGISKSDAEFVYLRSNEVDHTSSEGFLTLNGTVTQIGTRNGF